MAPAIDARRAEMVIAIHLKLRPEKLTRDIEEAGRKLREAVVEGGPVIGPERLDQLFRRPTG